MLGLEFYRSLPAKVCVECGCHIDEQHESYLYECERCLNTREE